MSDRVLIVMRHAEAAPAPIGGDDKLRHLTSLGKSQAQTCGMLLRDQGYTPDIVLHSTARRIHETRDAMLKPWAMKPPQLIEDARLYSPWQGLNTENLLHFYNRMMDQADDGARALMVLGHNPTIAQFAEGLNRGLPAQIALNYPSATACVFISSAETWYEVGPDNTRLELIVLGGEKLLKAKDFRPGRPPAEPPAPAVK